MKVSVFGLGYVGSVSAASFAGDGHDVVGVDVNADKVASLNAGRSPIVEPGLDELIRDSASRTAGCARRPSTAEAVRDTDLSLSASARRAARTAASTSRISNASASRSARRCKDKDDYHVVVVRSTVLPGTTHDVVIPALERDVGQEVRRRLRRLGQPRVPARRHRAQGLPQAAADAGRPQPRSRRRADTMALYAGDRRAARQHQHPRRRDDEVREQHLARAEGRASPTRSATSASGSSIDSHEVMDIFCRDEKLNLSPYYLKPGFAFGGSCLPKDVRALQYRAKEVDLEHAGHLRRSCRATSCRSSTRSTRSLETGKKRVGLLGFSFKAGTDDLRESPIVILAEALLGKGFSLLHLRQERLAGAAGRREQGIHQQADPAPVVAAAATRSTRCSTAPT